MWLEISHCRDSYWREKYASRLPVFSIWHKSESFLQPHVNPVQIQRLAQSQARVAEHEQECSEHSITFDGSCAIALLLASIASRTN